MITLTEGATKKLPGETSLFVNFAYNPDIVEIIKSSGSANFDKNTKVWEVPLTSLAYLVDRLCAIDTVQVQLLPYEEIEYDNSIVLHNHRTKPFAYQEDGIKFGLQHDKWLLLDAPGLGKSLQAILLAEELKERHNIEHCLIICGINTLKANWKKEISMHSNLSCRILGERTTRNDKLKIGSVQDRIQDLKNPIDEFFVVTNIETLRNDDIIKEINKGKVNKFDMIVVDEIHKAKNVSSAQGKNLLKLKNANYKIGMTGTLLMNSPLDLYLPLRFIDMEKANNSTFKYYYCNFTGPFNNILLNYKNMDVLKSQLNKCSLRRTKDLLDLPPKTIITEYVDMNDSQEKFYNDIAQGIVKDVDKVHMSTANLLGAVTRLRQATAYPSILTSQNIPSSKVERCCDLVQQIVENGDKVVVFSTFKDTLNEVMNQLSNYTPLLNTGDVEDEIISDNIDKFQNNPDYKIFCGTWSKCGTGITLTAANYMIFLDTPWTDSEFQQSQDRIYRIGTTDKVFIYNLVCKNTIDEKVLDIVQSKEALADYVVDDKLSVKSLDKLRKYIDELSQE